MLICNNLDLFSFQFFPISLFPHFFYDVHRPSLRATYLKDMKADIFFWTQKEDLLRGGKNEICPHANKTHQGFALYKKKYICVLFLNWSLEEPSTVSPLPDSELELWLDADDAVDAAEHSESDLLLWMASIWEERSSSLRRR